MSYLIVDQADNDLEMANDPFLEANISVPDELPYQSLITNNNLTNSVKFDLSKEHSVSLVSISTSSTSVPELIPSLRSTNVDPSDRNPNGNWMYGSLHENEMIVEDYGEDPDKEREG